jgi:hypothetical protein
VPVITEFGIRFSMRQDGSVLLKVWPQGNNGTGPAQYEIVLSADKVPVVHRMLAYAMARHGTEPLAGEPQGD